MQLTITTNMFRATKELKWMRTPYFVHFVQGNKRKSNLVHTTCATAEMAARRENTSDLRNTKYAMCMFIVQSGLVSWRDKETDLLILADNALQPLLSSPLRTRVRYL